MARRNEHTQQQIKEMVLVSAEKIVEEEGFLALKVRKIVMDIGYTVGSVYMVFENMDDLIMHLKSRTLDDLATQLNQVDEQCELDSVIQNLALTYLNFANRNFHRWEMLFIHRHAQHKPEPDWYDQKVDELFCRVENRLNQLSGKSRSEAHLQQAARALWSGIHGICFVSLQGQSSEADVSEIKQKILLLVNCFLYGWIYQQHTD